MFNKTYILSFLLVFSFKSYSEEISIDYPDSIVQLFKSDRSDLDIYEKGISYTYSFLYSDNALALYCAEKSLEVAFRLSDSIKIALNYDALGEVNRRGGEYKTGISYLNKSLIIKKNPDFNVDAHDTYNILGKIYTNMGEYDSGVKYFMKAVDAMDAEGNLEGKAFYLNNVGVVFDLQEMYQKALEYYSKSLAIKKEVGMVDAFAASYTNIAIAYFNLGKIQKSLEFHLEALSEYKRMEQESKIGLSYNNIGFVYLELKDYKKALDYFRMSLAIREEIGDQKALAKLKINMALTFLEMDQLDSAEHYIESASEISNDIGAKSIQMDLYQTQSAIYEKQGKFDLALAFYKNYFNMKDTIRHEDVYESMIEMETKYNLSEKEKDIQMKQFLIEKEKLETKNQTSAKLFYLMLFISTLIAFSLLIIYYFNKIRQNNYLNGQLAIVANKNDLLEKIKTQLDSELKDKKDVLDRVFSEKQNVDLPEELLALSKRELEVLSFLALGWTDQLVADKLFVSRSTVKTHLRRIYSKLLVNGRAGAVAIAHQYKIIGEI